MVGLGLLVKPVGDGRPPVLSAGRGQAASARGPDQPIFSRPENGRKKDRCGRRNHSESSYPREIPTVH